MTVYNDMCVLNLDGYTMPSNSTSVNSFIPNEFRPRILCYNMALFLKSDVRKLGYFGIGTNGSFVAYIVDNGTYVSSQGQSIHGMPVCFW